MGQHERDFAHPSEQAFFNLLTSKVGADGRRIFHVVYEPVTLKGTHRGQHHTSVPDFLVINLRRYPNYFSNPVNGSGCLVELTTSEPTVRGRARVSDPKVRLRRLAKTNGQHLTVLYRSQLCMLAKAHPDFNFFSW